MANHAATTTDASQRAWRTLVQGLAVDVLLAIAAALLVWLPDADLTSGEAWAVLGVAVAKTALTAVASYVMRLKVPPAPVAGAPTVHVEHVSLTEGTHRGLNIPESGTSNRG